MTISDSWQSFSVAEFWQSCNWNGELLSQETLLETELEFELLESWQKLSVEDFFTLSNWNNKLKLSRKQQKLVNFSTTLSVTDFWQYFAWQGQKVVPTLVNKSTSSISSNTTKSITKKPTSLTDLAQLF